MLLSDAIDHYRADRKAKGYAKSTIVNEQSTLRRLLAVIGNIQVSSITTHHMDRFWHHNQHKAPGTFNKDRGYLSSFFKWCQVRGYMPRTYDPMEGTRDRRVPPRDFVVIPPGEFPELLAGAKFPRNRALVAIGLYLFTRVSETGLLRWRDLDFENKAVRVFRTKTQTVDDLPMCAELEEELRRWRMEYGRLAGEVPKPGWCVCPAFQAPVFEGVRGQQGVLRPLRPATIKPTSPLRTVTECINVVLKDAGYYQPGEGGHTLRRSGAIALYNELIDRGHDGAIRVCQAMLGHSSVTTTEIYLRLDLARKTRNDLLAGKPMFSGEGGEIVELGVGNG